MWDGKMNHARFQVPGALVIVHSLEKEPLVANLMGNMVKIRVLERKDKQAPGRSCYLMLYEWMEVKRKGEMIKAKDVQPGDVVWWADEPLKVVSIEPWEESNERQKEEA